MPAETSAAKTDSRARTMPRDPSGRRAVRYRVVRDPPQPPFDAVALQWRGPLAFRLPDTSRRSRSLAVPRCRWHQSIAASGLPANATQSHGIVNGRNPPRKPHGSRPALAAGSIITRFRVAGEVLTVPFGTPHLRIRQVPRLARPGGRATHWADASRPQRPRTSGQRLQWAAAHSTFSNSQDAEHRHEIVGASVHLSNFAQREPECQERCASDNSRGPLRLRHRTPRRHLQFAPDVVHSHLSSSILAVRVVSLLRQRSRSRCAHPVLVETRTRVREDPLEVLDVPCHRRHSVVVDQCLFGGHCSA